MNSIMCDRDVVQVLMSRLKHDLDNQKCAEYIQSLGHEDMLILEIEKVRMEYNWSETYMINGRPS